MKILIRVLAVLILAAPLPAWAAEAGDDAVIAPIAPCVADGPVASVQGIDPVAGLSDALGLETFEPIPQSCHSFCEWYCNNELQFCLSGCSDFMCELGCMQQHQHCYYFCTQDC